MSCILKNLLPYLSLFVTLATTVSCSSQPQKFDVLIEQAKVLNGLGGEAIVKDVGIRDGKIVFVGEVDGNKTETKERINGEGYTLSPGFIDVHTHSLGDLLDSSRHSNLNYLMQGVTTVFAGNDGRGPINVGQTLAVMDKQGIGTNAALLIGHGAIRQQVMDMSDAQPNGEQMERMKEILRQGLQEGAFGMSTGLYYTPGNFAQTEEVIELTHLLGETGGVYDSHIRDESSYNIGLDSAIRECIAIARATGVHVNISHIKALGVDVWGKSEEIVKLIEKAQAEGLSLTADQYPYRASGTSITAALVPQWVFAEDFLGNMRNPDLVPRIRKEMSRNLHRRGGAASLLFTDYGKKSLYGKTLEQVAEERGKAPMDAAWDIVLNGGSRVASFNMNPDDIHFFMQQDWVMTSSDGSSGHPRKYGSYPKKIREYVLEKKILSLPEMVRKSTSFPAETFGIKKRGKIQTGYYADLILFKPEDIQDQATFEKPAQLATGMYYVIVNGKIVIEKGKFTGEMAGIALRSNEEF